MLTRQLPKILYLSDVPVESTFHGSLLIYRLLADYPPEHLLIVEPTVALSRFDRRLPGVSYSPWRMALPRLFHSRLAESYGSHLLRRAPHRTPEIARLAESFQAEAVLTVTHGYSWITAASFALRHHLPLHLICHDDWLPGLQSFRWMKAQADRTFGRYYRAAASRLCVSPQMADCYERRYGAKGSVLYPSRAKQPSTVSSLPNRSQGVSEPLTVAYAGTLNHVGYAKALSSLAAVLDASGGKLVIYGPLTFSQAETFGLNRANIVLRGLVTSVELIARLREEADVLFVPMSFSAADRPNMEISFPSKLVDYTAAGLPLLINGPAYCSAIRWARENPGVAEVVEMEDSEGLKTALANLQRPEYARQLAERSLAVGKKFFSHESATAILYHAITLPFPSPST